MAATSILARFFKVFLSHYCSESMVIPDSFYAQLPSPLPKTVILRGTGGCFWKVAMITRRGDVYFEQGWPKFVEDNRLTDGDFLTFIHDGNRTFEVSNYGLGSCKETRIFAQVIDVSDDSSSDSDTDSESEMVNTIHIAAESELINTENTLSESEIMNTEHTPSEPEMVNTRRNSNRISRNRGKSREVVVEYSTDEDSDGDSDSFYFPDSSDEDRTAFIKQNVKNSRNKGKSKLVKDVEAATCSHSVTKRTKKGKYKLVKDLEAATTTTTTTCSRSVAKKTRKFKLVKDLEAATCSRSVTKKTRKHKRKIQNPEAYTDDPNNLYVETTLKNRTYELLIDGQLVRDYELEFADELEYIDDYGKLPTTTTKWADQRAFIKKWNHICSRNRIKKEDCVLCELLRNGKVVYAIKVHVILGANV